MQSLPLRGRPFAAAVPAVQAAPGRVLVRFGLTGIQRIPGHS